MAGFPRGKLGGKGMGKKLPKVEYDMGWIQMIKEAKNMGLTPVEVRVLINRLKKRSKYPS